MWCGLKRILIVKPDHIPYLQSTFKAPPSNLKPWQGICKFVSIFCRFYKYSTFRNSSFLWNNQLNWNAIKGFWPEWGFFKLQLTNRIENLSMPVMIKMEMGKSDECHSRQPKTWVMPTFVRKKKIENILKIGYTNDALLCKVYYDNLKQFFFTIVLYLEQKIPAKNGFSMGH